MIETIRAYASLIKLAIFGLAALIVLVFYEGIPFILDGRVDAAFDRGVTQERAVWEEAQRKLRADMEAARLAAQAKIDALETEYLARRQSDAVAIAGLEEQINEMEAEDGKKPAVSRPAVPAGVSVQLDKVGR